MSISDKVAQKISSELHYDEEKSEVISYGLFAFIHIITSLALVALFGFLFGVLLQALVVSFALSILRQYSGGAHATRPSICLIIGTIVTIAIALIVHYLSGVIAAGYQISANILIMIISYYFVIKYAPVDSPAKPIKKESKRKKMKKLSLIVLSIYIVFISVLIIIYLIKGNIICIEYAMCICLAVGWQVFNLTIIGHRVLNKVDSFINKILFIKGENNK